MKCLKSLEEIKSIRSTLKADNKKVAFTNGCFDLIHAGHIDYLNKAKALGDVLIVGLNSDYSVKRIKGEKRPIINEDERAEIISNIKPVDYVVLFDEDTPAELIKELVPDLLIKGADWKVDKIVGAETVLANGGEVKTIEFINDQSTSKIVDLITSRYSK